MNICLELNSIWEILYYNVSVYIISYTHLSSVRLSSVSWFLCFFFDTVTTIKLCIWIMIYRRKGKDRLKNRHWSYFGHSNVSVRFRDSKHLRSMFGYSELFCSQESVFCNQRHSPQQRFFHWWYIVIEKGASVYLSRYRQLFCPNRELKGP